MKTWAEYLAAKTRLLGSADMSPIEGGRELYMSGGFYDNQTSFLETVKGKSCPNVFPSLFAHLNEKGDSADFVGCEAGKVRAHVGISTGGHPALVEFSAVYYAGEIHKADEKRKGWFKFKSGHHHPKQVNVVPCMYDLIETSCGGWSAVYGARRSKRLRISCW